MGVLQFLFYTGAVTTIFLSTFVFSVEKHNFKTCRESSFCLRHRSQAKHQYPFVVSKVVHFSKESITLEISSTENTAPLSLSIHVLSGPIFRFKVNEIEPLHPRFEVPYVLEQLPQQQSFTVDEDSADRIVISYGADVQCVVVKDLLLISILHKGEIVVQLNRDGLLKFEEYRRKPTVSGGDTVLADDEDKEEEEVDNEDRENDDSDSAADQEPSANEENEEEKMKRVKEKFEKDMWEESFKSHRDSKPKGPASVGMDIAFPGFEYIYGIPEHTDSFNLANTKEDDGEPYRLYNLDVFKYEIDSRMALYGAIPFVVAHNMKRSVGMLWVNAAETWIDVERPTENKPILKKLANLVKISSGNKMDEKLTSTHWMSESGIIDVFVMLGPSAKDVSAQYASLTGLAPLPPAFAISYHQCRWNYNDEEDCRNVDKGFDDHDIPFDVLWLDIEHTVKRYFTWDAQKFPDSVKLLDDLNAKGRKMVTIVDPHIKRTTGYHVYDEGTRLGHFIKSADKGDYKGWCWPGDSSWVDFLSPAARVWWAGLFSLEMYKGSTVNLFTWNDMNEPSVFNGPEITMHKDAMHHGSVEHRDIHNMYGMLMVMATNQGQLLRSRNQLRPFVLSRAFFAGSQRFGAIWTGDNDASWPHLKASIPMLLSLNVAGLSFAGADVGGFFGDPQPELLVRWYQLAAFTPFFRSHAHIETKRREPWLFGPENTQRIRNAIRRRYIFLPYWYTQFFKSSVTGQPLMRPYWFEFPEEEKNFAKEDAFLVGPNLLVAPVLYEGATNVVVTLPGNDLWYDYTNYASTLAPAQIDVHADLDSIPVFYRGGSIIPSKHRIRRSSVLARDDPLTLIIAPNKNGEAEGDVYVDDEHTFQYRMGIFLYRHFTFANNQIVSSTAKKIVSEPNFSASVPVHGNQSFQSKATIERIIILNVPKEPAAAELTSGKSKRPVGVLYDSSSRCVTLRKPDVGVAEDFSIQLKL